MKVHRYFGLGFPEIIYKRALLVELRNMGLICESEIERDIYYGNQLIARRRIDLIVEGNVLVELKATSEVSNRDYNQIINYLRIFKIEVGLLLNFGKESLEFKRFVLSESYLRNQFDNH